MYSKEMIDFFKKHNLYSDDAYSYVASNSDFFDYTDQNPRACMGFAANVDEKNNKLRRFGLVVPFVVDFNTLLLNVNLFAKGLIAYKYLDKKFIGKNRLEALALLYEKLYIIESNNKSLEEYGEELDSLIEESDDEKYLFALYARNEMLEEYNNDYNKMCKLTKKLDRKYRKSNK